MTNAADEPRRELFLRDDLEQAEVVRVHREALRALRDSIEKADIDAYSDLAWPPEVVPAYEQALAMAATEVAAGVRSAKSDPTGIGVDVRDDAQFDVLVALVPYTIHAEAWRADHEIYSASDTGTALCISVTAEEEARLMARLDALGIPRTVFTTRPRRRRGLFRR